MQKEYSGIHYTSEHTLATNKAIKANTSGVFKQVTEESKSMAQAPAIGIDLGTTVSTFLRI
jgi:hypothetical protein